MKPIVREHFFNWSWDAAHLDSATEFWLRLAEQSVGDSGRSATFTHDLDIHLSGFPERQTDSHRAELNRRAAKLGVPGAGVRQEFDELVLATGEISGEVEPPAGLALSLLGGPPFVGLVAEFRFRVVVRRRRRIVASTLILVGELQDQRFLVKALWMSRDPAHDNILRGAQQVGEGDLVAALDRFRESGTVATHLYGCFGPLLQPPRRDSLANWEGALAAKIINVPFGRSRVRGLLARWVGFATVLTVLWGLTVFGIANKDSWKQFFVLAGLPALIATTGFVNFVLIEKRLLFTFRQYRLAYAQNLRRFRFIGLSPGAADGFVDDPAIRKATADLQDKRFTHVGDVTLAPGDEIHAAYRIFRAADGVTYLVLGCARGLDMELERRRVIWPASVFYEAQTFFTGDGRVGSLSVQQFTYWRRPPDANTLLREVQVFEPNEFFRQHVAATEAFADERSLTPVRHERFEGYIQRQQEIHDAEIEYLEHHPYSWRNHMRWYLQLPRPEYGGKR